MMVASMAAIQEMNGMRPSSNTLIPGHNHSAAPEGGIVSAMRNCPACRTSMEEHGELIRQAIPLYKEVLSFAPALLERLNSEHAWSQFIGSSVVGARNLVARSKGLSPPEDQADL